MARAKDSSGSAWLAYEDVAVKFWLVAGVASALACSRQSKPSDPDAGSRIPAASSVAVAPPTNAPLHAELDASGMRLGAARVALEPLAIRGALARARGSASTLTLTLADGTEPMAIWAMLLAARGTDLERVVIERKPGSIAMTLHSDDEHPARRRLMLLSDGKIQLIAGVGERALPTTWTVGDQVGEQSAWAELKRACAEGPCSVRLELSQKDAPQLSAALDSWQRISTGLPNLNLVLGTSRGTGRPASNAIQAIMKENHTALTGCYERGLEKNPKLHGRLQLRFVIARDGSLSSVADLPPRFPDKSVRDCILQTVSRLHFPAPDGASVTVVYPLVFSPE